MGIFQAIISGLGGMFGWGLADFFAKKTIDKFDSIRTLLWMQIFGIAPLSLYLAFNWENPNFNSQIIIFLLLLGLGQVVGYLLFYKGLEKGCVSILSPVFASQSVIAVLVSAFIFGEEIKTLQWAGIAITFLGIILASFQPQGISEGKKEKKLTRGILETLIGMLIFGFFFPCWNWFLEYQQQGWVMSTIIGRIISVVFLILIICFAAWRKKIKPEVRTTNHSLWFWLVLIGLFDAIAVLSIAWGLRFSEITGIIIVISAAFPLPTVILARIFLKEKVAKNQIAGIVMIILGLIVLAI